MTFEMRKASRSELLASAANWLLRLRDPSVSPTEIRQWMAWCDASTENQQAFNEMERLWQQLGDIEARPIDSAALAQDDYLGQVSVAEWRRVRPARGFRELLSPVLSHARKARVLTAAVAAGVIFGVSLFAINELRNQDVVVVTSTGRNEQVELPDGSLVTVAAGSRLATHYTKAERTAFLERGEAYFKVRKDRSRPFVVHALDSTVTAVGTAFNIRAEQGTVRVAVTEGVVEVGRREEGMVELAIPPVKEIRLLAGEQVILSPSKVTPTILPVDVGQATSWVSGTLKFVNEPLSHVVAAVNRYSPTRIELVDGTLAKHRYTGTVVTGRVDEWLRGLPDAFPVAVREVRIGGAKDKGVLFELVLIE